MLCPRNLLISPALFPVPDTLIKQTRYWICPLDISKAPHSQHIQNQKCILSPRKLTLLAGLRQSTLSSLRQGLKNNLGPHTRSPARAWSPSILTPQVPASPATKVWPRWPTSSPTFLKSILTTAAWETFLKYNSNDANLLLKMFQSLPAVLRMKSEVFNLLPQALPSTAPTPSVAGSFLLCTGSLPHSPAHLSYSSSHSSCSLWPPGPISLCLNSFVPSAWMAPKTSFWFQLRSYYFLEVFFEPLM